MRARQGTYIVMAFLIMAFLVMAYGLEPHPAVRLVPAEPQPRADREARDLFLADLFLAGDREARLVAAGNYGI